MFELKEKNKLELQCLIGLLLDAASSFCCFTFVSGETSFSRLECGFHSKLISLKACGEKLLNFKLNLKFQLSLDQISWDYSGKEILTS